MHWNYSDNIKYQLSTNLVLVINSFYSGNFKTFKIHKSDLSQKSPKPSMWLLVNHTKTKNEFVLKLISFNSGQLQVSEWAVTK